MHVHVHVLEMMVGVVVGLGGWGRKEGKEAKAKEKRGRCYRCWRCIALGKLQRDSIVVFGFELLEEERLMFGEEEQGEKVVLEAGQHHGMLAFNARGGGEGRVGRVLCSVPVIVIYRGVCKKQQNFEGGKPPSN